MKPIPPLILRHAQDAAWYYEQIQADHLSPLVDFERSVLHQGLLTAHLDGLRFAGELGLEISTQELAVWKSPGALFSLWHSLLTHGKQEDKLEETFEFLSLSDRHLSAAAWALVWLKTGGQDLNGWLTRPEPWPLIALEAAGLGRRPLTAPLSPAGRSPEFAKCLIRYAGRLRLPKLITENRPTEAALEEETALALLATGGRLAAAAALRRSLLRRAAEIEKGEGLKAIEAEERAELLAACLGRALPSGYDPGLWADLESELPFYLFLIVLANFGEVRVFDRLWPHLTLDNPRGSRILWAISFITGLRADEEDLELTELPAGLEDWPENTPGWSRASGLAFPDPEKLRSWWARHENDFKALPAPLLAGRPVAESSLTTAQNGFQDRRFCAAWHMIQDDPGALRLETRAPIFQQRLWLRDLAERRSRCI